MLADREDMVEEVIERKVDWIDGHQLDAAIPVISPSSRHQDDLSARFGLQVPPLSQSLFVLFLIVPFLVIVVDLIMCCQSLPQSFLS